MSKKRSILYLLYKKLQSTLAVHTNGFSLVTSFGTHSNSLLTDSITFFHGWVEGAKIAKSTFTGTIEACRSIWERSVASLTHAFATFAVTTKKIH